MILTTQISNEESESKLEYDDDEVSTLELCHGSKDSYYNEVINGQSIKHPSDGELEHACGESASLNGLTKVG